MHGNDFNPESKLAVDQAPPLNIQNYEVNLSDKKDGKKIVLEICENGIGASEDQATSVCTEADKKISKFDKINLRLKTVVRDFKEDVTIIRKIKISCKK